MSGPFLGFAVRRLIVWGWIVWGTAGVACAEQGGDDLEKQFRELPMEARRLTGRPWRLEVTRLLKPGTNEICIEPLAPAAVRLLVDP